MTAIYFFNDFIVLLVLYCIECHNGKSFKTKNYCYILWG